jgi:threonine synthase
MRKVQISRSRELSRKYCADIFLKPEWFGETGSLKDAWAITAVKAASKVGAKRVVVMSAGNQGLALAAAAQKAHIQCAVVIHLERRNKIFERLLQERSAEIFSLPSPQARSAKFAALVKNGYMPLSLTLIERNYKETIGIEGSKTTAYEIYHKIGRPDFVIVPTCYGDFAEGVLRGFIELQKRNRIQKLPRFILARAKDPQGNIAFSISTNVTTPYVKHVLKMTNGKSFFLKDTDFMRGRRILRRMHDFSVQYASAGPVICLEKMKKSELVGQKVVLLLTATEKRYRAQS